MRVVRTMIDSHRNRGFLVSDVDSSEPTTRFKEPPCDCKGKHDGVHDYPEVAWFSARPED